MLRRLSRISFVLVLIISSEVWALGLGEIRLDSALNEPLRAEIELLSATAEELNALRVTMASSTTFERYGLDRPVFLQGIEFMVVGNVVEVRSRAPVTEPFVTFLVEASWSRGRLLREYTMLLDPPTFAPPAQAQQPVTAPQRSAPSDSGRIERAPQAATPRVQDSPAPVQTRPSASDDTSYSSTNANEVYVAKGQTLWGIARQFKPDDRLTTNQTMLAIYEASPEAFGGNINLLRAGARLRIPSADEILRISRGDALNEVKRQNSAWGDGSRAPAPVEPASRPSLTLVPPDEDVVTDTGSQDFDSDITATPLTSEEEVEQAISRLEAEPVPDQPSLIEIRDNELAALRNELSRIRDEIYGAETADETGDDVVGVEEPFDDSVAEDDTMGVDDVVADETAPEIAGDTVVDDQADAAADATPATSVVTTRSSSEPSLFDKILGALTSAWAGIIGALILVVGLLFWFMRRGGGRVDEPDSLYPLDADDVPADQDLSQTETLRAPVRGDESFVVVEQDSAIRPMNEDTIETPAPDLGAPPDVTKQLESIEDTFSAETAINLDQTDPIAEADFHMAYGLYDQAADLINGGLEIEPERQDLLTKLCEIYFVWGNKDAFVDAAGRLRAAIGGSESSDWDKIVIMGQQIAGDNEMFAGAGMAAATKVVDLSFDSGTGENQVLDMELGSEDDGDSVVIDLGTEDSGADFMFGGETASDLLDSDDEVTIESPTIEEQFDVLGGTAELPSLDSTVEQPGEYEANASDETAEINLDDLGLDISGLAETEIASLDDLDVTSETAIFDDVSEVTGKNPEIDPDSTGARPALSGDSTGMMESLADMDIGDISGTNATLNIESDAVDTVQEQRIDESLLDATGMTQVLDDDFTVETNAVGTTSDVDGLLSDAEATLLAPGYGDEDTAETLMPDDETIAAGLSGDEDFDFASTEALPSDVFTGISNLDETGEMPSAAGDDDAMDLDDLTAALKVSAMGDTVDQPRDDPTVEQLRPDATTLGGDTAETVAIPPGEMRGDLHDARTMTEVGTKLDLARAYVDMGDPAGARSILEEVLDEGDESQRQQAQKLMDSLA